MKLSVAHVISSCALLFAISSFAISFITEQRVRVKAIRPILVFEYSADEAWVVRNIGNGPALHPVVFNREHGSEWSFPVRIPALGSNTSTKLQWLGHSNINELGVTCEDFEGRWYSSVADDDRTTIFDGHFVDYPQNQDITPYWRTGQGLAR